TFSTGGPADADLADTVAAIEARAADQAGALLGAFNIRYIVLERGSAAPWLSQRDLAVVRDARDFVLLENTRVLDRASILRHVPPAATAVSDLGAVDAPFRGEAPLASVARPSSSRYEGSGVDGPGVAWIAEASHPNWDAILGGVRLPRLDAGWANAFRLPGEASGDLTVSFRRPPYDSWWLGGAAALWVILGGVALARAEEPVPGEGRNEDVGEP
nr:hypothetical protein [Actinomycetota bacterium]